MGKLIKHMFLMEVNVYGRKWMDDYILSLGRFVWKT